MTHRLIVAVTTPANWIGDRAERTTRHANHGRKADLDRLMAANIAGFAPAWPGPGEVANVGRDPGPGGAYLGRF